MTWSNNRGGNGTASGTSTWNVTGIALQTGTNVITVTALDAAGNTGQATLTVTYNPPPPPSLQISRSGNLIVLSWLTNAVGFTMEYATNLPATSWISNSSPPAIVSGQYTVTNTISENARFYRLQKP